ncbi:MAG TPA: hypothetical protein PKX28_02350 [Candidatus Hydrogenedentes bacterium]|nr:hypothetical protein [Candidatus Hydrogenedentota bacterium]HOJ67742.1 hypothetical protein [Candidatus Hydrogenedentota bacterium]HOK89810.1 hypothetical protein [Candidatus Hydrogenedentota bacterium]HOV61806.1 hypothetical protein [Candidatus Hydrogenedentota bacterium]HPO30054.1 hypothetical protein [Candidatus Hydrogenedentota bacterium]
MRDPLDSIFGSIIHESRSVDLPQTSARPVVPSEQIRLLERRIDRLALLCQALWELLREQLNLTDAQLETIVANVDERDGARDGAQREHPVRCSRCGRINSSRRDTCLYCGLEFQRDVFNL